MNSLLRRSLGLSLLTLSLSACGLLGGGGSQTPSRQPLTATRKPQAVIGLALGGGASKGFAHIGVIKVLEENNIPVKIVTGTSAGALVGSLIVGIFVQMSTLFISTELKNVGALAILILILLIRPQGILGQRERVG